MRIGACVMEIENWLKLLQALFDNLFLIKHEKYPKDI